MDQVQRFLKKYFSRIETPMGRIALQHASNGEWAQLQELRLRPLATYKSAEDYYLDSLVVDIFRKSLLPGDADRRKQAAIANFWSGEASCKQTNLRLTRYIPRTHYLRDAQDVAVDDFIGRWRKEVARVLGRCSYNLIPAFSGGSTLSDNGMRTTIPDKMSSVPTATLLAVNYYADYFRFTPQGEKHPNPTVVRSNRFFTVPKDSQKDRGCCVEPSVNVSLQLSVGKLLKRRFKRAYQVDLATVPLRHRRLAQLSSAGRRELVTIDLSNASDTIARVLIELLLPSDWWQLLNSLRSHYTDIGGKTVYLEKFSSMGNGFTFELETILFRTLCDTVIGARESSTFGDDIIVPTCHSEAVLKALRFFGFTPNERKTFCEGPFRESCGGDYFLGKAVRPHFIKQLPDEPQHWIALANGLKRVDPYLKYFGPAWYFCQDQVPKAVRECRGPKSLGDIVFHDDTAEPTYRSYSTTTNGRAYENTPAPFFRVYRPMARTFELGRHFTPRVAMAAGALGVPANVAPRDSISGYKLDWVIAWGRNDFWGHLEG